MKGAVLYRLGMNWIKERKMRRNYGIEISTDFTPGVHPESSRYTDASGRDLTRVGLEWVAYKVINHLQYSPTKQLGSTNGYRPCCASAKLWKEFHSSGI